MLTLTIGAALVAAPSARAEPTAPYLLEAFASTLDDILSLPTTAPPAGIATEVGGVEVASGGAVASAEVLGASGTLVAAGSALAAGAIIVYTGVTIWEHFTKSTDSATYSVSGNYITNFRWKPFGAGSQFVTDLVNSGQSSASGGVWALTVGQGCSEFGDANYYGGTNAQYAYFPPIPSPSGSCGNSMNSSANTFYTNYGGGSYGAHKTTLTSGAHSGTGVIWLTVTEFGHAIPVDQGPETYTSQTHTYTETTGGARPSINTGNARTEITASSPGTQNFYNHQLDPTNWDGPSSDYVPGVSGSAGGWISTGTMPNCIGLSEAACTSAMEAAGGVGTYTYTEAGINEADLSKAAGAVITQPVPATTTFTKDAPLEFTVNPDPLPIEILEPGANETYDSYIARLQADGYVGTATTTELSETQLDPTRGPSAVVRTTPAVGTRIVPSAALTVWLNPSTAPGSAPGDDSEPPSTGGIPPAPASGCDGYLTASVDLSPLEVSSVSDKFPFALFGWVGDELSSWGSGGGDAPSFTIPLMGLGDGQDITVDLSWFEPAMPVVRSTLVIVATIGLVWWLGTALLGIPSGGGEE